MQLSILLEFSLEIHTNGSNSPKLGGFLHLKSKWGLTEIGTLKEAKTSRNTRVSQNDSSTLPTISPSAEQRVKRSKKISSKSYKLNSG